MESDVNKPRPLMQAMMAQMLQTEMERLAEAPVQAVSAASRDRLRALMLQHGVTDLQAIDSLPVKLPEPVAAALALPAALLKALAGTIKLLLLPPGTSLPALAVRQAERGEPAGQAAAAWVLTRFQPGDRSAVLMIRHADNKVSLPVCQVLLMSRPALVRAGDAAVRMDLQAHEALALAPMTLPEDGRLAVQLPAGWAWEQQVENRPLPSDAEGMLWIVLAAKHEA